MHNHIETTLLGTLDRRESGQPYESFFNVEPGLELGAGRDVGDDRLDGSLSGTTYEISFRAKWITGCNQLHTHFLHSPAVPAVNEGDRALSDRPSIRGPCHLAWQVKKLGPRPAQAYSPAG